MRTPKTGSITRLEDKPKSKCRKWVLRVSTEKGVKSRRFTGTYSAAEIELDKFRGELLVNFSNVTFREYCCEWIGRRSRNPDLTESTISKNGTDIRRLLPIFGDLRIVEMNKNNIEDGLNRIRYGENASGRELSGTTMKETYSTLKTILDDAVWDGKIPLNPVRKVRPPRVDTPKKRAIPFEDVLALFKRLDEHSIDSHTIAVRLAVLGGLRRSEICGLNWSDIEGDMIHVRRSIDERTGKPKQTKSRAGLRNVPMLPALKESLLYFKEIQKADFNEMKCPFSDTFPVCASEYGTRMRAQNLYRWWINHRWEFGTDADLHELRHTFLTMLAGSGANALQLKSIAGWSSIQMADTYIHNDDAASLEAIAKLDKRINSATSSVTSSVTS